MRFLLGRLLHSLLLLIGASLLSFLIVQLAPGNYFESARLNPELSAATLSALQSEHGMNKTLAVRYARWIRSVVQGRWGFSLAYNTLAAPILWSRSLNTLLLTSTGTLLAWILAVPLGMWAAVRPGSWIDSLTSGAMSLLLATPELVIALLLLLFAVRTGYFPAGGMSSLESQPAGSGAMMQIWVEGRDLAGHLFLPGLCLAAGLLPVLLSHTRAAVRETLHSPFVMAARSYGIPFHRILLRQVLPAAANPIISLFGLSLGMLLSSSLLIEVIFSWPGLGQLMVRALLERDPVLIVDVTVLAAAFLVAGNFTADILLYLFDPRIRREH